MAEIQTNDEFKNAVNQLIEEEVLTHTGNGFFVDANNRIVTDDATKNDITPSQSDLESALDRFNTYESVRINAELARQTLADGATFSKQSLPLIKAFNDDPEADVKAFLASGGSSATLDRDDPLNQTYTHWRPIFESLSDDVKVRIMWHGYMHSATFEFYPEPETPSAEYKAWFNNACSQVIGYMTDRAQM